MSAAKAQIEEEKIEESFEEATDQRNDVGQPPTIARRHALGTPKVRGTEDERRRPKAQRPGREAQDLARVREFAESWRS